MGEPKSNTNTIAGEWKSVTPADGSDLPDGTCNALYIGVAGDVSVDFSADNTANVITAPAGAILPGPFTRVRSTSTSATGIYAIY